MKKIFKVIFSLTILAIASSSTMAQINYNDTDWGIHPMDYSRVGGSGWQFLKLPTNARTAAMGGVNSAIGYGDANSAFTNPASAADVNNISASFNNMEWVADIGYNGVSVIKNMNRLGVFGLNISYVNYGDMIRTENMASVDQFGNDVGIQPTYTGLGTFSAHDMAIGFLYSRRISNKLQLGGNLKYLEEKLDDATTSNWTLDIGTMYFTGFNSLRISMLGRSFGPDAEFSKYDERIQRTPIKVKMPMMFVLGAAYDLIEKADGSPHRLIIAGEYVKPNDGPDKGNFGSEYTFMSMFTLRAGYRYNYDEEGLTFGGGFSYSLAEISVSINYAFIDAGLFDSVNMLSIGIGM